MANVEMVYKVSKKALKMVQQGLAEWTKGGIRDIKSKKIIELAKPVAVNKVNKEKMLKSIAQDMKASNALAWVNTALNLANLGVSVAGFYLTLTRMESLQGEIHQFITRYKSDRNADQLEKYKTHLMNITSNLNFLQNRYESNDYDKQIFIIREVDIEKECNETAGFLEKILEQYQSHEIDERLACQILFTLTPAYAQLVNEYCCQYYCTHQMAHQLLESWMNIIDQINSDSFRTFMKREMIFNVEYVRLSPQRRSEVITIAFHCIQELKDNLINCAEVIQTVPAGMLVPVAELINAKSWDEIRDRINTEQNETPEEYMQRQLYQMAVNDDGEDVIYIPVTAA